VNIALNPGEWFLDHVNELQVVFDYCMAVARGTVSTDRFEPVFDKELATTSTKYFLG
jgi:hypothetical protein